MEHLIIKPKPGLIIRNPEDRLALKPDANKVRNTSYWRRRIKVGDVEVVPEKQAAPARRAAPAKEANEQPKPQGDGK